MADIGQSGWMHLELYLTAVSGFHMNWELVLPMVWAILCLERRYSGVGDMVVLWSPLTGPPHLPEGVGVHNTYAVCQVRDFGCASMQQRNAIPSQSTPWARQLLEVAVTADMLLVVD